MSIACGCAFANVKLIILTFIALRLLFCFANENNDDDDDDAKTTGAPKGVPVQSSTR